MVPKVAIATAFLLLLVLAAFQYTGTNQTAKTSSSELTKMRRDIPDQTGIAQFNPHLFTMISAAMHQAINYYNPPQTFPDGYAVSEASLSGITRYVQSTRTVMPLSIIIGPIFDETGKSYYDVHPRQVYWNNYGSDIFHHLQNNCPKGIKTDAKIFLKGTISNPYSDELFTASTTNYLSDDLQLNFQSAMFQSKHIGGTSYIAVYVEMPGANGHLRTNWLQIIRVYRVLQFGN
eukprot:256443_1